MQGLATDNYFIPGVHLDGPEGVELNDFMVAHTGVTATFTGGTATETQGDAVMADFSSRGGPNQTLGVNKLDITAPGVQILAAMTPLPATVEGGLPGQLFQAIQGTSMSSPHIAGSAAMLKDLNPGWTPGQIKSAMMLTAVTDIVKEDGVTPADAYDTGSGRVDLTRAGNPLITMDESIDNYYMYADSLWNANYPSFYHPNLSGEVTVNRTFKNERNVNIVLKATVDAPDDVEITVSPESILIPANGERTVQITVNGAKVPLGDVRFAMIYLTQPNGRNQMVFPVSFVRGQSDLALTKTCDPTVLLVGDTSTCTVTVENTTFDDAYVEVSDTVPRYNADLIASSVEGAEHGQFGVWWSGWLEAAQPPLVNAAVDPLASPAGYLPLSAFGISPISGVSDESITNYNVPAFWYAGKLYSRIGIVSNGYAVVGGGTGQDVDYINSNLPDPAQPNNVLAPFWTDLNPTFGGTMRIGTLGDGVDTWIVLDWESVSNYGDGETNSFQIWIGIAGDGHPGEDISFTYGPDLSDGDGGYLTVGAENEYGNSGQAVYFDGAGEVPMPSYPNGDYEVDVFSSPGAAGGSHTITYDLRGMRRSTFTNCAEMTSPWYQGTTYSCVDMEIVNALP
ncbi:MAG: S8 family serine peptidase [Chloroflexota bacterium]